MLVNCVERGFAFAFVESCARDNCDCKWISLGILGIFPFHASPAADRTQGGQGQGIGFFSRRIPFSTAALGRDLHLDSFGDERLCVVQVQVSLLGRESRLAY